MPHDDLGKRRKRGKAAKVMHEYKQGELHLGSKRGPLVTSRDQAVAIAMSESGQARSKRKKRRH